MSRRSILRSYLLDEQTLSLIDAMRRSTDHSMSQVIRWAVAHYAQTGPWTTLSGRQRQAILGKPDILPTGPPPEELAR